MTTRTTAIGRYLTKLRTDRGLKKYVVEEDAKLGSGVLTRAEKGPGEPDAKTLEKLAVYYGVPVKAMKRAALDEDVPTTTVERPQRYYLAEERLAWARQSKMPQALIDMFIARVGAFKGEPSEAEVDAAWAAAERRLAQFEAEIHGQEASGLDEAPRVPKRESAAEIAARLGGLKTSAHNRNKP